MFQLRGLSVFEISLLLALWSGITVFFEVPSGALADKWNRKYMISLSMFFKAVCFIIWIFANNFLTFALGFVFAGVSESFRSGTEEALLYDTLKSYNKENKYNKITGKAKFYEKIAVGSSIFIGGFLASISFNLTTILSVVFMLIAMIFSLRFKETKKKTSTEEVKYFKLISDAVKQSLKNKIVLKVLLFYLTIASVIGILDEYDQLYLNWINIPIAFFGVWGLTRLIVEAIGSRISHKKLFNINSENMIRILGVLSGIALIISISFPSVFILPVYILTYFFTAISEVLIETKLQKQIQSQVRATVISIAHLIENLSVIILTSVYGLLSTIGGLYHGFLFFAIIIISYPIITLFIRKEAKTIKTA
ncbi:MAG: MFS transporter [Nanoarchaeota archaeon]|nr:MFS transporter [Nanoarchaeota archaeon]